ELFKPFVMSRLVARKHVQNIKAAKKMVESEHPEVWDILEEVIAEHPVLLNRAPTLHRLGIQAFEPVLIEGKAIQLHPLVCTAFNADFDGDQMAVHLPLSVEAQAEARILMLSSNNILSPAHGRPIAVPTQDMILGCYYLTYFEGPDLAKIDPYDEKALESLTPRPRPFGSIAELEHAYAEKVVDIQDPIIFRWEGGRVVTTVGRAFFNSAVAGALRDYFGEEWDKGGPDGRPRKADYQFQNKVLTKNDMSAFVSDLVEYYGATAVASILDVLKDLGFHYATVAGVTISKNDIVVPPEKEEILERYEAEVRHIQEEYLRGNLTDAERRERVIEKWTEATEE
ncbi:MAG: DNA-directed RNA polymerase subunit beta', partial [Thermoleophilia bacterium]|nr:DNA-directed RNA polymerase subunit beta' [Thermoleophilia bacterium]